MDSERDHQQSFRVPGGFPSPTTPAQSVSIEPVDLTSPRQRCPISPPHYLTSTNSGIPLNYTAPPALRERPVFSGTQSEERILNTRQEDRIIKDHSVLSSSPSPQRPLVNRRGNSDTRHNRPKSTQARSSGSPIHHRRKHLQSHEARRCMSSGTRLSPPRDNFRGLSTCIQTAEDDQTTQNLGQAQSPEVITPQRLHEELRGKVQKELKHKLVGGIVYILQNPLHPHLLKIGSTRNFDQRIRNHESRCKCAFEIVYPSSALKNHGRAEELVKADLKHLRRILVCPGCSGNHIEYFEVEEAIAKRTVQRWVKFMQGQPYNNYGQLKGIWKDLIDERLLSTDNVLSHDLRMRNWTDVIIAPTQLDYGRYILKFLRDHRIWFHLWEFKWQVLTVSSWLVTWFALKSEYAFFMFFSCLVCAVFSISGHWPQSGKASGNL